MNCPETREFLPLYLAKELEPSRAQELEDHVRDCPECAREMEQQMNLDQRLRATILAEDVDTTGVDKHVRQQIAAEPTVVAQPSSSWRRLARWPVAAGIAVLLLAGVLGYRLTRPMPITQVHSDAVRDHGRVAAHRQWISDPAVLAQLARQEGIEASMLLTLAPAGYRLKHGKACGLDGRWSLHLVYTNGTYEVSVFLRQRDAAPAPGRAREIVNGRTVYAVDIGSEHLTFFQTEQLTAMVVSDQSIETAMSIASSMAQSL